MVDFTGRWKVRPLKERFWEKVDKRGRDECWLWVGARTFGDYGVIGLGRKKLLRAHRLSYEFHKGPIPDGLVVRHICDNPPCVNPDHLLVGTMKDNTADAVLRGRVRGTPRKLSDDDVVAIRASSNGVRATAREYGVSPAHISLIRSGHHRRSA